MYLGNRCSQETHLWLGLISIVVGAIILLQMLGYIPVGTLSFVIPSLLIVVGLKLVIVGGKKDCMDCIDIMDCMDCCGNCEIPAEPAPKPKAKKKAVKKTAKKSVKKKK